MKSRWVVTTELKELPGILIPGERILALAGVQLGRKYGLLAVTGWRTLWVYSPLRGDLQVSETAHVDLIQVTSHPGIPFVRIQLSRRFLRQVHSPQNSRPCSTSRSRWRASGGPKPSFLWFAFRSRLLSSSARATHPWTLVPSISSVSAGPSEPGEPGHFARSGRDPRAPNQGEKMYRFGLRAGLAAATAAVALASAGPAAAAFPEGAGCPDWADGLNAYAYANYDLPECRLGAETTRDYGTQALRAEGTHINMRRALDTLLPNPSDKRKRVHWPLVDSFGRTLAYLSRESDRWQTTDLKNRVIYRDYILDSDQLTVQGRGCMTSDALESQYALVAFAANDRSTIPVGASIVPYQIRAFIDRRALPEMNAAGQPIRSAIDSYSAGCGEARELTAAAASVADPNYDSEAEQFYGEDGIARTYATYNTKPLYQNARYFIINSTSVHGGGIVRGIVQQRDLVAQSDRFGYCDQNAITGSPVATWIHGRIGSTRMWGWLPKRCNA